MALVSTFAAGSASGLVTLLKLSATLSDGSKVHTVVTNVLYILYCVRTAVLYSYGGILAIDNATNIPTPSEANFVIDQ